MLIQRKNITNKKLLKIKRRILNFNMKNKDMNNKNVETNLKEINSKNGKTKFIEKIKENKIDIIIFLIYAIVTFVITIIFHEKWRDEAQAWLIARDLDFWGIIKQMTYEGHPPLWHFILAPFAKLGFPYITESVISWLIMCVTAGLILKKAPFKKPVQVLILLTAPFIYLYPTIARSYCLVPLALVLIAILYKNRHEKPIKYTLSILFLAYTHMLMWGLVGILYLFFFLEEIFYVKKTKKDVKNIIIALIIAFAGLIILFYMLSGGISQNTQLQLASIVDISFIKIRLLFVEILSNLFGPITYSFGFRVFIEIFAIVIICYYFKKNSQSMVIAIVSILWPIFVYLCIYGYSTQKINLIILTTIFIAWIIKEENNHIKNENESKNVSSLLDKVAIYGSIFVLLLNAMQGISWIQEDISTKYSFSKEVAEYINQNLENDSVVVSVFGPYTSAVIPYTETSKNIRFWSPSTQKYFTYMDWDDISNEVLNLEDIMTNIQNNFKNENVYILSSNDLLETKNKDYLNELQENNIISKSLYESAYEERSVIGEEEYALYKVNLNNLRRN